MNKPAEHKPMKVFISYSRKDTPSANVIAAALERAADCEVFSDTENLEPGREWIDQLWNKVKSADLFVVIISSYSMSSNYCRKEWEMIKERVWKTDSAAILPLVLGNCELPAFLQSWDVSKGTASRETALLADLSELELRLRPSESFKDILKKNLKTIKTTSASARFQELCLRELARERRARFEDVLRYIAEEEKLEQASDAKSSEPKGK